MEVGDFDYDKAEDMVMDIIKLDHVLLFVMMGLMLVASSMIVDEESNS